MEKVEPLGVYTDAEYELLLAAFNARLAKGDFGRGKGKAVNSLGTYTAAVNFHRDSHFERNILKNVVAGVRKEQQGQSKPKRTVTMEIMCALTAMNTTKAQADKDQRLPKLARALAYNQLGQGILRKQSAVCNSEAQWDAGIHLCVADVQILRDQHAVAWGLKHQKQDRPLWGPAGP